MALPHRHRRHGDVDSHKIKQLHKCITGVLNGTSSTGQDSCLGKRTDVSQGRTKMAKIINKLLQFHTCVCNHSNGCRFNLLLLEPRETLLERCFDKMEEAPFPHKFQSSRIACRFGKVSKYRIRCEVGDFQEAPKSTRLEDVLHCFSHTMEDIPCSIPTTPALTTTTTLAPPVGTIVVFVLAFVISILLGMLGTGLGICCWRKKTRNRPREEASGDQSKNYVTPVARYCRQGDTAEMVVELPHLQGQNVYHDYHILEPNTAPMDQHVDSIHQIDGENDDGYDPVCNTYEELEDCYLEARPAPKPRF